MKLNFLIMALIALFISKTALAYEVDQFTRRNEPVRDSTALIDAEINKRIQYALESTNPNVFEKLLGVQGCGGLTKDHSESRRRLFTNLRDYLATQNPIGLVEAWSEKNNEVAKRRVPLDQSIYRTAAQKSLIIKFFGIASVVSVNNEQIGTDKLGHFLSEGYNFYLKAHTEDTAEKKTKSILLNSFSSEIGIDGFATTNIKSYADMAVNYDGTRFWNKLCGHLTLDSTDTERTYYKKNKCLPNSFLKCEGGSWILNAEQKFTLKDYVTPAWDETINCSTFHDDIDLMVKTELSKLVYLYKGDPKMPCPAEPSLCLKIKELYPAKIYKRIVHPSCQAAAGKKINSTENTERKNYQPPSKKNSTK